MRRLVAALALTALAGVAHAQYKTPPAAAPAPAPSPAPQIKLSPNPQPPDQSDKARRISRDEAVKMVKQNKAVWIDVRGKDQYDIGHIPGAINIPLSELQNRFKDLPPKKFLITYCA